VAPVTHTQDGTQVGGAPDEAPGSGQRPPGRPRSADADAAILGAARELLAERGWDAMTVGDVAARAGVAKSTLYRRWPGKAELVVDAMAQVFDWLAPIDAGSVRADAEAVIRKLVALWSRPEAQAAFLALAAQSARDPVLRKAVREKIIDRQRRLVHASAALAAARGESVQISDPELLFDVIAGTVVQRLLIEGEPLDEGYLRRFLDLIGAALHC
jgi:AcrR family transcriptional regulator